MGLNWVLQIKGVGRDRTGKGDRWGRDSVGRSEPAFLSANIFALPPTYLQGEPSHRQLLFRCEAGHLWPFVLRPVPGGESAGCVRLQCLFCGLFACSPFACHAHCPHQVLAPVHFAFPRPSSFASFAICSFHVRQDQQFVVRQGQQFASCKTVPLAAATRACSGGPCTGSLF